MKRLLSFSVAVLTALTANAIELPDIIGDNMILQQKTEAKLWGWAKAGNTVQVVTSWNGKTYTTQTGENGRWEVMVATPKASYDQYTITFKEVQGKSSKVSKSVGEAKANGVLIGEVWFCSGQSNMEMPLGGFWNCPVEGSNDAIAQSGRYKNSIRVATIPKVGAQTPQDTVGGKWTVCEPENASKFSACGYFFATTLRDMLDVPVGIINCSWGGSCVEGWLPKDTLLTYPDGLTPIDDTDYHAKMIMFNGMLSPLAGYTIKGFIWNQGESNVGREKEYIERFTTMTRLWRKMWAGKTVDTQHPRATGRQALLGDAHNTELPMYTVELPPYWYDNAEGTWGAAFRQAQHTIAHTLENSGCVCTSDLVYDYEMKQIHGSQKQKIGQRLAYMALTRDYGMKGVASEAPEFEFMVAHEATTADKQVVAGTAVAQNANEKGTVYYLYFTNSKDGFDRLSDIEGFEAQGADGKWYPATVWADSSWKDVKRQGCFLKLVCPEAGEVKNIRYCYHNFVIGKLHNSRGLPVVPFTTE